MDQMIQFYTKVMGFRRHEDARLLRRGADSPAAFQLRSSSNLPVNPEARAAAVKKMGNWQEVAKNPASLKRGKLFCVVLVSFRFVWVLIAEQQATAWHSARTWSSPSGC